MGVDKVWLSLFAAPSTTESRTLQNVGSSVGERVADCQVTRDQCQGRIQSTPIVVSSQRPLPMQTSGAPEHSTSTAGPSMWM